MQIEIRIDENCKEPKLIVVTDRMTDEVNAGTICITLSNGTVTYVARRSVAKIKQLLGI